MKMTLLSLSSHSLTALLWSLVGFTSSIFVFDLMMYLLPLVVDVVSFFNYVLLTVVYGSTFIIRRKTLKVRWYYYLLLAILDVEGNFSVVKAYQYTSLTSVMLLDCWTIPCVLLLTWLFIKTKYNIGQLIGVCIRILGLVLVILSDVHAKDRSGGSNVLLGDALVIIGATLYEFTNVSEEFLIKNVDFLELMTFLGLFGSIISGIQVAILERKELALGHAGSSSSFCSYSARRVLIS
ncbi:hypothetical protein KP509_16G015700 [Ceratopteris richardii]|uniref:Solute carrier family 35 member F1 n=1 Tax=Ceratopteris richardii TaxID=49495 RepID=A0A8T2T2I0_CERRI|nr:hypothetical protein KP509_16G015700 [Ceratopteris richardii]